MALRPDNSAKDIVTIPEVKTWLVAAQPGDCLTYYVGDLAHDRVTGLKCRKEALNCLADEMMRLDGKVDLVRRRQAVNVYLYQAIKRKEPGRPVDWESFGKARMVMARAA